MLLLNARSLQEDGVGASTAGGEAPISALSLLQKRQEREGDLGDGDIVDEYMTFDLGR